MQNQLDFMDTIKGVMAEAGQDDRIGRELEAVTVYAQEDFTEQKGKEKRSIGWSVRLKDRVLCEKIPNEKTAVRIAERINGFVRANGTELRYEAALRVRAAIKSQDKVTDVTREIPDPAGDKSLS
jgi:hypothetical protein